eukprot:5865229-Amphidinium_carterae.1
MPPIMDVGSPFVLSVHHDTPRTGSSVASQSIAPGQQVTPTGVLQFFSARRGTDPRLLPGQRGEYTNLLTSRTRLNITHAISAVFCSVVGKQSTSAGFTPNPAVVQVAGRKRRFEAPQTEPPPAVHKTRPDPPGGELPGQALGPPHEPPGLVAVPGKAGAGELNRTAKGSKDDGDDAAPEDLANAQNLDLPSE